MAVTVDTHEGIRYVKLKDALDIAQAAELKGALMEAFASSPRVSIQVAGVSGIDVTIVQLLCAAVSHAKSTGTDLVLEGPVSDAVIKSLAGTGILPLMSTLELRSEKEEDSVLSGSC